MPGVQFEGEGQQPGQAEPVNQTNNTPAALTPELVEALRGIVRDETAKGYRAIQSSQSKLEKRINEKIQQLQGKGVEITPEIRDFVASTVQETEREDEPASPPPAPVKPAPATKQIDPSEAFANAMGKRYKVEPLDESDPEAEMLKGATSLDEWEVLVIEATQAKAKRIQDEPPKPKSVPNAVPAAGAGQPLYDQYRADLAKLPRGDIDAIYKLKADYARKGLKF